MTAAPVFEAFGGLRPTAEAVGVAVSTAQHWQDTNRIPGWRRASVEAALERAGKPVPIEDGAAAPKAA